MMMSCPVALCYYCCKDALTWENEFFSINVIIQMMVLVLSVEQCNLIRKHHPCDQQATSVTHENDVIIKHQKCYNI